MHMQLETHHLVQIRMHSQHRLEFTQFTLMTHNPLIHNNKRQRSKQHHVQMQIQFIQLPKQKRQ